MVSYLDAVRAPLPGGAGRPVGVGLERGTFVGRVDNHRVRVEVLGSEFVLPAAFGNYPPGGVVHVQWDRATDLPVFVYGPAEGGSAGDVREPVTVGGELAGDPAARAGVEVARAAVEVARGEIAEARAELDVAGPLLDAIRGAEGEVEVAEAIKAYLNVSYGDLAPGVLPPEVVTDFWENVVVAKMLVATDKIITSEVIADDAVTARALNVVSTSGSGHSWRLDENGFVAMRSESQAAMRLDSGGLRFWDADGNMTVRLNGVDNQLGGRLMSGREGARGVIVQPTTGNSTIAGIWFSNQLPLQTGADPAIWVEGAVGQPFPSLNIRAGSAANVTGTITIHSQVSSTRPAQFGSLYVTGVADVGGEIAYNGVLRSNGDRHSLEDKPTYLYAGINAISGGRPAVFANTNGRIDVASSSGRYKVNRDPMTLEYAERLLDLDPITYYARSHTDGLAELLTREANGEEVAAEEWARVEYLRPFPGVLAEDVAAAGLEEFVFYNVDPEDPDDRDKWVVDGVRYGEMVTPLIVLVRDQRDRIAALESRLTALEASA